MSSPINLTDSVNRFVELLDEAKNTPEDCERINQLAGNLLFAVGQEGGAEVLKNELAFIFSVRKQKIADYSISIGMYEGNKIEALRERILQQERSPAVEWVTSMDFEFLTRFAKKHPEMVLKDIGLIFRNLPKSRDGSIKEPGLGQFKLFLSTLMQTNPQMCIDSLKCIYSLKYDDSLFDQLNNELLKQLREHPDATRLIEKFCKEVVPFLASLQGNSPAFKKELIALSKAAHQIGIDRLLSGRLDSQNSLGEYLINSFAENKIESFTFYIADEWIDFSAFKKRPQDLFDCLSPFHVKLALKGLIRFHIKSSDTDFIKEKFVTLFNHLTDSNEEGPKLSKEDFFAILSESLFENKDPKLLTTLIKGNKEFFQEHFVSIFESLTIHNTCLSVPKLTQTQFFRALEGASIDLSELLKSYPEILERYEICQKSGECYECISREEVYPGKYEYAFVVKYEYMDFSGGINSEAMYTRQAEIFPAIELGIRSILMSLNRVAILLRIQSLRSLGKELMPEEFRELSRLDLSLKYLPLIEAMGYKIISESHRGAVGYKLLLPDRDLLMHRYNQYRIDHRDELLPELDIIDSPGIASDSDFVDESIEHNGMISEGKEMIHDLLLHILPLLKRASLGSKRFDEITQGAKAKFKRYREIIEKIKILCEDSVNSGFTDKERADLKANLPIFKTLLGALVDTIAAEVDQTDWTFRYFLDQDEWLKYFRERYNDEHSLKFDEEDIKALIKVIQKKFPDFV